MNFEDKDRKEYYLEIRHRYNNPKEDRAKMSPANFKIYRAAQFFFLNKVGFNGIYRVNSSGKFNVPVGSSKTIFIPSLEEFREVSHYLRNKKIVFRTGDYLDVLEDTRTGDLIYLDPPYFPDETSNFVGYTDPKFREEQHVQMLIACKKAFDKGASIVISNSNSNKFQELVYDFFDESRVKVHLIPTKRSINPNAENKSRFVEKLYIIK